MAKNFIIITDINYEFHTSTNIIELRENLSFIRHLLLAWRTWFRRCSSSEL